jgi:site-specific recombinase XerD
MRTSHSDLVGRLIYEMELRNYSENTIRTYSDLLSKVEESLKIPLDKVTTEQLKNYLHYRIKKDEVSTSLVNQSISAWKILQVDVLKREWETVQIKRPRRVIKLPVVMSVDEVERLIAATSKQVCWHTTYYEAGCDGVHPAVHAAHSSIGVLQDPLLWFYGPVQHENKTGCMLRPD